MSDLIISTYKQASDSYSTAQRWSSITVTFLLFLHITTFSQYLGIDRQLRIAAQQQEQLAKQKAAVDDLAQRTLSFRTTVDKAVTDTFGDSLVESLRSDFLQLDSELTDTSFAEPSFQPQMQQMQIAPVPPHWEFLSPEEVREINEMPQNERDDKLKSVIQHNILQRRFGELASVWQRRVTEIENETQRVEVAADSLDDATQDVREQAEQIKTQVAHIRETAKKLKINAPAGDWWQSVEDKGRMATGLRDDAANVLAADLPEQIARDLKRASQQAYEAAETSRDVLTTELETVVEQFKAQYEKAAALAKPLALISLDAQFMVSRFPLLIGLGTGICLLWLTERRNHLGRVYAMTAERDEDIRLVGGIVGAGSDTPRHATLWGAAGAAVWIAVATYQLASAGTVTGSASLLLLAAASSRSLLPSSTLYGSR